MGDLRDLLRAALEDDESGKGKLDEMRKLHENTFGKVRARYVYNASIEWTMHEVFSYAMSVLRGKDQETCAKAARLIGELRDTLIASADYDSTKMPSINYFHSLSACKEAE